MEGFFTVAIGGVPMAVVVLIVHAICKAAEEKGQVGWAFYGIGFFLAALALNQPTPICPVG